jgi:hypothetical protein
MMVEEFHVPQDVDVHEGPYQCPECKLPSVILAECPTCRQQVCETCLAKHGLDHAILKIDNPIPSSYLGGSSSPWIGWALRLKVQAVVCSDRHGSVLRAAMPITVLSSAEALRRVSLGNERIYERLLVIDFDLKEPSILAVAETLAISTYVATSARHDVPAYIIEEERRGWQLLRPEGNDL